MVIRYLTYACFLTSFYYLQGAALLRTPLSPCKPGILQAVKNDVHAHVEEVTQRCLEASDLHAAAVAGDIPKTRDLALSHEKTPPRVLSPLMCALAQRHTEVARLLLKMRSFEVAQQDQWGLTALFYALNGSTDLIDELLDQGAHAHLRGVQLLDVLFLAALFEQQDVIEKLREVSAQPNIEPYGSNFFTFVKSDLFKALFADASQFDTFDVFNFVALTGKSREFDPSGSGCTYTCEKLRFALEKHLKKTQPNNLPLLRAILANNPQRVASLIERGALPVAHYPDTISPIDVAALVGSAEVIDSLVTTGKKKNNFHFLPYRLGGAAHFLRGLNGEPMLTELNQLHLAALASNWPALRQLSTYGFTSNRGELTPLHLASQWATPETVATLLELGANVSSRDESGLLPLHFAIDNIDVRAVTALLIRGGASLREFLDKYSTGASITTTRRSSSLRSSEFIRGILDALTDLDENNGALLITTLQAGGIPQVAMLLKAGARADTHDDRGRTVIHHTVEACCKKSLRPEDTSALIKLLTTHGADIDAQDAHNKTALNRAIDRRCMMVWVPLLQNNATILSSTKPMNECYSELYALKNCSEMIEVHPNCKNETQAVHLCIIAKSPSSLKVFDFGQEGAALGLFVIILFYLCCR